MVGCHLARERSTQIIWSDVSLAVGALAALLGRGRNGSEGVHVEVAQLETVVNLLGDLFLQESVDPGSVQPEGNRSARGAPWGVYQCLGNERWCVITVRNDQDWRHLGAALGNPAWSGDPRFATVPGRLQGADQLDEHLSAWTAQHSDYDVMHLLQSFGVPCGVMAYPSDHTNDAHLMARGYPRTMEQPPLGQLVFEGPAVDSAAMVEMRLSPAPALAQHSREICRQSWAYAMPKSTCSSPRAPWKRLRRRPSRRCGSPALGN